MKALPFYNEQDLLQGLQEGNEVMFAYIYRSYVGELMTYIHKTIGCKEDCEEIIQDIFESLWARHSHIEIISLKGYLFRMAKNKVASYIRHHYVHKRYEEHFLLFEAIYETVENTEMEPEKFHELIETTIKSLPERCQMALRLRLRENLSNNEIAERMNITRKTVENYMQVAISKLRISFPSLYLSQ